MDLPNAISQARPDAQWSLSGDDYATLQWIGPGEPPTMEELEAAWAQLEARKIWHTVADFWAEFSDAEKLGIADSTITGIRLLHEELRMWRGEVWSDDVKVQSGLDGLIAAGILSTLRKDAIVSKQKL
jgi:hypothetical protein